MDLCRTIFDHLCTTEKGNLLENSLLCCPFVDENDATTAKLESSHILFLSFVLTSLLSGSISFFLQRLSTATVLPLQRSSIKFRWKELPASERWLGSEKPNFLPRYSPSAFTGWRRKVLNWLLSGRSGHNATDWRWHGGFIEAMKSISRHTVFFGPARKLSVP